MGSRVLAASLLAYVICFAPTACSRVGFSGSSDGRTGPRVDLSVADVIEPKVADLRVADLVVPNDLAMEADLVVIPDARSGCLPWTAATVFSAPQPLPFNSNGYDQEPFLSHDGLTLYFSSNRPGGKGGSDLYFVRRPNLGAPFGNPEPYNLLNTVDNEWRFIITADGLTAYLSCDWPGGAGGADLWWATRATTQTPFQRSDFKPLNSLNTPTDEHDPYPSADHKRLYFYSTDWESPGSAADLLVAERTGPGTFAKPVPIPGVNAFPFSEGNPVVSADELMLVFSSTRAGSNDLWLATRASTTMPFVVQHALPPIISSPTGHENNQHITADGCGLYFGRNDSLFFARVLPPGGS